MIGFMIRSGPDHQAISRRIGVIRQPGVRL